MERFLPDSVATQKIPLLTESEEMLSTMFCTKCIEMYCSGTEIDDMDISNE